MIISLSQQNILNLKKKLKTLISRNGNLTAMMLLKKLNYILQR